MINLKRAVLLLPVYIAAMITIDIVFKSAHIAPSKPLPVWIVAGFIASAIVVVAVGIWYFTQRRSSKVTPKREHAYIAIMAGVALSGFVGDTVSGVAGRFTGGIIVGHGAELRARLRRSPVDDCVHRESA